MKRISLLDCTLRDGGFINGWKFGEDCIINVFERLELAGIDIIEVGYLRDYVPFDLDETQFPNTAAISRILPPKISKSGKVVAIIDFGDCALENIEPCNKTILDGIRVTFKRKELAAALDFCKKIKEKGYFVSLQPVSFMDYSPQDVLDLVTAANELKPFAVCIVDTYGFMNKRDLLRYYSLMDETLSPEIALGYHSHNNFQLAYSNAIELVEQFTKREMIVDCSVLGMGKGAGNAATELLALHINNYLGGDYDLNQILEIADTYIEKERKINYWGYSLKCFLAAANYCHHKYISFLLDKKMLSIKSINEIISRIDHDKKTCFDEKHIVQLYREYQEQCINDKDAYAHLRETIGDKPVLVLAPGSSLLEEKERIEQYITEFGPYVISTNHLSDMYRSDAVFISNHKRYSQIAMRMKKYPMDIFVVATSNINPTTLDIDCQFNYSSLLVDNDKISDNSTLMLVNIFIKMGLSEVVLAGFDGYKDRGNNYFDNSWDFMGESWLQNEIISKTIARMQEKISIRFLTTSYYQ